MTAREAALPDCCKNGHAFKKFIGVFFSTLVCIRCGKKVRRVGA